MTAEILTRSYGGVDDKKLSLYGNQVAFTGIGTSWNVIRIGVRTVCNIAYTATSIKGNPRFFLGMIASPNASLTNGTMTRNCSHFVGAYNVNGTCLTTAGPPAYITLFSNRHIARVGTTDTIGIPGTTTHLVPLTAGSLRTAYVVQITKGSPNFTIEHVGCNSSVGMLDLTLADFITGLNTATMTNVQASFEASLGVASGYYADSSNVAVNEGTNGYLNSIYLGYNRTATPVEFSEIVYRIVS